MAAAVTTPKQPDHDQAVEKPKRRKRGRWLRRGLILAALVGTFGWFAPSIVATTKLHHRLPKFLFPEFTGAIEFGETQLGWVSPVVIKNLCIRDEDGSVVLEVGELSTSEPLWKLAVSPENLGTFNVIDPVLHVTIKESDSNIERLIASLAKPPSNAAPDSPSDRFDSDRLVPSFIVEIANAAIDVDASDAGHKTTIDPISLRLVSRGGTVEECDLAIGDPPVQGSNAQAADWLAIQYGSASDHLSSNEARGAKHLSIRAANWKLDRLQPVLSRWISKAELRGGLNANATVVLTPTKAGMDWDWMGDVSIHQLVVAGFESLRKDRLVLDDVELSGRIAATSGRLAMHEVKLATDVGELAATGDIPLRTSTTATPVELAQSFLSNEDYHIDGFIDLKRLAAMAPHALRIREGIEIASGDVKLDFVGSDVQGIRRWSGVAGITGLSGIKQGVTIRWDKPIAARVNAHREDGTIVVDLLECRSDFFQAIGNGTLDDARFKASGDLAKLLVNIDRFFDLEIDELKGQLIASGEIRRIDNDRIALTSKVMLEDLAYVASQDSIWRERHLEVSATAEGRIDSNLALTSLETSDVQLSSGGDSLELMLQKPIDLMAPTPVYSAVAHVKGDIAAWQNRLQPLHLGHEWKLAGTIDAAVNLTSDIDGVSVNEMVIDLSRFEASNPDWVIQDPEVKLQSSGRWDKKASKWTSPKSNLVGKNLTLDLTNLEFAFGPNGLSSITGNAVYNAELTQLSAWKNLAIKDPSHYLIGSLSGTAGIKRRDGLLTGSVDAQIDKFILAGQGTNSNGQPQWIALWKEPRVRISGNGSYNQSTDRLTLESSRAEVEGLSIAAKGSLDDCSSVCRADVTGDLAYDWEQLTKRIGSPSDQTIQMTGKDRRPFFFKGSLNPGTRSSTTAAQPVSFQSGSRSSSSQSSATKEFGDLTAQAGIGWNTANLFGLMAGTGEISTHVEGGICRLAPLDIAVNDGRLHATPTIYLDRDPYTLVLLQEKLIDQVSLSAELCHNSLRFVAPLLAESAQVDGKISVDLLSAVLPLSAPATGTIKGTLSVHRAQARPGPLALQLLEAVEQLRSIVSRRQPGDVNRDQVLVEMTEQQVPFKLEGSRVYHSGMTFQVRNVTVMTKGSVGVDNTLDLVAAIPIKDEWLNGGKAFAGLRGQTIQVPITGAISHPKIDGRVIADIAKQLDGSALKGLLKDKVGDDLNGVINNGIDKLLRGKK